MQDLKVTLVQTEQFWENKEQNLAHFESILSSISDTDLILLPEMFHTGFSMNAAFLAEDSQHSEGINWLKNQSKKTNAAIYTSLIIKDKDEYKNRGVFVEPSGQISIYDKVHLFSLAKEDEVYTPGKEKTIVTFRNWKIALQICYDLRFPELARNRFDLQTGFEYDCLLYVANWPERRITHWETLLPARAIENQVYVVGVNRVGTDGKNIQYNGSSMAIDALGTKIGTFEPNENNWKTIILNKSNLDETRSQLAFLKDRIV